MNNVLLFLWPCYFMGNNEQKEKIDAATDSCPNLIHSLLL